MMAFPDIGTQPTYGLSAGGSFARDVVNFGDGYELRRFAGLQPYRRSWSVTWTALTVAQRNTLRNFLVDTGGVYAFEWKLPDEPSVFKVICPAAPMVSYDTFGLYTVTATFEEDQNL